MASFATKTKALGWMAALLLSPAVILGGSRRAGPSFPTLVPGETLLYVLEYRSSIQSQSAGPIYTAAEAHGLDISVGSRIRLDVLGVRNDPGQGRLTRLRVTYETCDARVHSDAYDPGAETLQKEYGDLRGRWFEFTIDEQGRVRDVVGLDKLEPDENARNAIRQWLSTITVPMGLWKPGLKPGKKWSSEIPLAGIPLAGLAWRTVSSYRDNEPCPPPIGAKPKFPRQSCAVITTRLETVRKGPRGDPTPLAYLRQGLKTSGRWTGSGQSLSYISLSNGLVFSSTATENDMVDLTVASTLSGSRLRYAARTESRSQIALISITLPGGSSHAKHAIGPAPGGEQRHR
ncbi:MAG TPA: hypothetical protein VNJ12_14325 [Candidatus Dormibacteraeota bacterium]|nr:hypothetical protein [Candidatus Dormibacteraeota bacterium]